MAKPSEELIQARAALAAAIADPHSNVMDRIIALEKAVDVLLSVLESRRA